MRSIVLITLLITLSSQTLYGLETNSVNLKKLDLILKKGDIAPFDGILQSEENYRFDYNLISAGKIYEKYAKDGQEIEVEDNLWNGFFRGLAAGLVLALAIELSVTH